MVVTAVREQCLHCSRGAGLVFADFPEEVRLQVLFGAVKVLVAAARVLSVVDGLPPSSVQVPNDSFRIRRAKLIQCLFGLISGV
jgi:hypothetical protein